MASRRPAGTRDEMIHCEYCGEDYAASYKRCPFCDGRPPEEDDFYDDGEGGSRGGGKRLATNTRGGGYGGGPSPVRIVGTVLSLALIIAAVCIVVSLIKPMIDKGKTPAVDPDNPPAPSQSQAVEPTQAPPSDTPGVSPSPAVPAGQTATGFTLDKEDFSMNDKYPDPVTLKVTFTPAGSTGTITWSSSDPDVASVDESGKVSPGAKKGVATITAAMGDGQTRTCTARNNVSGAVSSSGTGSTGTSGTALTLNRTDFSFTSINDTPFKMAVSGTSSTPAWSIGNTSVATIDADGTVRPVGGGHTTITCKVDGQTLTCVVRCQF